MTARVCGPCTECCTAVGVPELDKQPHVACDHATAEGCSIYPKRPESCRKFQCAWLEDGTLHRKDRPDKIGVVLDVQDTPNGTALVAFVTRPNADKTGRGKALLAKWAKHLVIFIVRADGTRSVLGPAALVSKIGFIDEHGVGGETVRHKLRVV